MSWIDEIPQNAILCCKNQFEVECDDGDDFVVEVGDLFEAKEYVFDKCCFMGWVIEDDKGRTLDYVTPEWLEEYYEVIS